MSAFETIKMLMQLSEDGPTITGMYAPTNGLLKPEFQPKQGTLQDENVPPTPPVDKPRLFGKKIKRLMSTRQRAKLFTTLRSRGEI